MPHPQARAWWADVQHLRDGYDRTDEARRRADEADLASRRATRERRHVEAEVSTVHAPADADYADALASLRDASATSGDAFAGPRGAHDAFAGPREARDAFAGPRAGREARDSQRDAFAGPRDAIAAPRDAFAGPRAGREARDSQRDAFARPRDAIAAPRRADATFVGRRGRIDGGFDPRRGHHVDLPPAPRVRQGIATPSGLDRPPRVKGDATPGRVTVEIRGRTVPAPAVPRSVEVDRRRPQRRAIERVGARPDRMAMWALLMGLLLILVAIGTADTPAASSLLLIFR
jgi:hypothetical protein